MATLHSIRRVLARSCASTALLMSCRQAGPGPNADLARANRLPDSATVVTVEDLRSLRWMSGTWVGEGRGVRSFAERYTFTNDSTLVADLLTDVSGDSVSQRVIFELRGGQFVGRRPGAEWVASRVTPDVTTFAPVRGARNFIIWRRVSPDEWRTILRFPAEGERRVLVREYRMRRVR